LFIEVLAYNNPVSMLSGDGGSPVFSLWMKCKVINRWIYPRLDAGFVYLAIRGFSTGLRDACGMFQIAVVAPDFQGIERK